MTAARFRAVAPGRVNLIGEHIDYNGLPVLPMAIDRAVEIEFRVDDEPRARLRSAVPARFAPFEFRIDGPPDAAPRGDWSNYARAAANGLLREGVALARGVDGVVGGDLPIAMGLASSSALVVATALALLEANGGAGVGDEAQPATSTPAIRGRSAWDRRTRLAWARRLARAERFVGLEGGGMDQAASLLGEAGHALRIGFDLLEATPVPMPESWRWVVASSLVPVEKSRAGRAHYNARVEDCRRALAALGETGYPDLLARGDVSRRIREAERVLESSLDADQARRLHRRFRHVLTEGRRVGLAVEAMRGGDLAGFGALMLESHASLREDYDASAPELDEIVEISVAAGAAGARLTGAGFGGCAIALCDERRAGDVVLALARDFFLPRLKRTPNADVLFVATPAAGARVERSGRR